MGGIIEVLAVVGTAVGATAGTVGAAVAGASLIATGIGMTMSVVGAVTHNKLLSQIGMGFSIAGAVGGLSGMAASSGLLGEGAQGAMSTSLTAAPGATAAEGAIAPTGTIAGQGGSVGNTPGVANLANAGNEVNAGMTAVEAPIADPNAVFATPQPINESGLMHSGGLPPGLDATATAPVAPTVTTPVTPTVTTPVAPSTAPSGLSGIPDPSQVPALSSLTPNANGIMGADNLAQLNSARNVISAMPSNPGAQAGWWASLDPQMKASISMVAGQTVAGGVGGIFTGMQADKQLALQNLINQQNRDQFNQQFSRATSSPGLIQFGRPAGVR